MNQLEMLPAPELPIPVMDKWRSEQQAFRRQLPELLGTHRNLYVAIHDGQVVESGNDKLQVASRAYARFGYIPIYVTLVSDDTVPVTRILSPQLLQRYSYNRQIVP